jgi:hypothetical protein
MVNEFEDIRPYTNIEIGEAIKRIVLNPMFNNVIKFLYPDLPIEDVKKKFRSISSAYSFQMEVMDYAIRNILEKSSSGLSYEGIHYLSGSKNCLFLSNHRDILMDSAILQVILVENKLDSSEITFGDNLMNSQFVVDIGKSNKMFTLKRGGGTREIFSNSVHTSKYIRFAINKKRQSVWIAQRNGRSKDGNDQTQLAVLKMLGMSGGKDFVQNFAGLNIVPIVISYEYEPCDNLKTREIYLSRRQVYEKTPTEDLESVICGIKQFKGKIHLSITPPILETELYQIAESAKNDRIQNLATLIDNRIYKHYKFFKNNYIAFDLLNGNNFADKYSVSEKAAFTVYMRNSLFEIEGDKSELEAIFLAIYANPVVNQLKIQDSNTKRI